MTGPWRYPPRRRRRNRAALVLPLAMLGALAIAGAAWGDSVAVIGSRPAQSPATSTYIELHAPTVPDADATMTFRNRGTNSFPDSRDYSVTWQGLTATVRFTWDAGARGEDRIQVAPPPGYRAVPDTLTLGEETSGEVHFYRWRGM